MAGEVAYAAGAVDSGLVLMRRLSVQEAQGLGEGKKIYFYYY